VLLLFSLSKRGKEKVREEKEEKKERLLQK